ncbi:hypothetical protein B7Y94_01805 [Candidatus Saccharibacteria bacterium 32-49-12]|nr:MAG: hypothetical protein B7Y94_01805 [Candidatus Saccharibacteria bacterium 32-49-12]
MSVITEKLPGIESGLSRHEFEHVMDLAYSKLQEYGYSGYDTRSGEDLEAHAIRTMELVASFGGNRLPDAAGLVALLHDVVDRSANTRSNKYQANGRSREAALVIDSFFAEAELPDHVERYVRVVSHGLIRTEIASSKHRIGVATQSAELLEGYSPDDAAAIRPMISGNYEGELPQSIWRVVQPYLDFDHMRDFVEGIDIDAIFIKGCELADNLKYPTSQRESALLQDVLEAESFYAPILEELKFDGLASLLRSRAHLVRLNKLGYSGAIEEAEERLSEIEKLGPERIISSVFGEGYCSVLPAVRGAASLSGRPPVFIGDISISDDHSGQHGHYRIKEVGSLADKILDKGNVMDIMGVTVVSSSSMSSVETFVDFISNRLNSEVTNLTPCPSPGKEHALYVQGDQDYVSLVRSKLIDSGVDRPDDMAQFVVHDTDKESLRGYKDLTVSKATFYANVDGVMVPTEVQFVTNEERSRMRDGEIMHLVYKYIRQENSLRRLRGESPLAPEDEGAIARKAVATLSGFKDRSDSMSADSYEVNQMAESYFANNWLDESDRFRVS